MGKLGDTSTDIGKCGKFGQITLCLINILFIILGIIAFAIGVWAIASGSSFAVLTGSQIIGGSALLIITGFAVVVIASLGLFGAMCKNRPLLLIYVIILLIIIVVEIVAGILAFVYRNEVGGFIQDGIETNLIANYNATNPSSDENRIVNFFQGTFSCCGFNSANDWVNLNPEAITSNEGRPPMCLECNIGENNCTTFFYNVTVVGIDVTKNFTTTGVGCNDVNSTALLTLVIVAGAIAIIFGILEIIGVLIGCLLCCCISRAKRQEVV